MAEVETVKERLAIFLKKKKISQSKFEKMCGMSNGYVNNMKSSISPEKLSNVARQFPELNIGWLLVGEELGGQMENATKDVAPILPNKGMLPLIPMEAFASPGLPDYDDIHDIDYYMVNEFKGCDFLVRIKGDSMSPRFASGDVVACKKILEMLYFQWGRVYVLYTQSNGTMIKRIQPSEKEDCIKCVSDNEKYAPFDVPKSDIVSLALVKGLVSLE